MCNKCLICNKKFDIKIDNNILKLENNILLIGNPNVGKSVIFSNLTKKYVLSSNYAGTTVSYTKEKIILDKEYTLIDVPGTYSLSPTSDAEYIAKLFLDSKPKAIVCVLDSTNLVRNLVLALEIKKTGIPVIYVLNFIDIAYRKGISIDVKKLSILLNSPVIKTVAVKGRGLDEIKNNLINIMNDDYKQNSNFTNKNIWNESFKIANEVTSITSKEISFIDKLANNLIKPNPGIFITFFIILLSLFNIVFFGKMISKFITYPLTNYITDYLTVFIIKGNLPNIITNILIGEYGIFVVGISWIFDLIFPFVLMFYIVFTFLEDTGILPRISVLYDNVMKKIGLQGGSLISLLMGYGCAVPAIISTRNATTKKERFIVTTMICISIPCISQISTLIIFLSNISIFMIIPVLLTSFIILFLVGYFFKKILKWKIDPIVIEIPNLLIPNIKSYFKKVYIKIKNFILDAQVPLIIALIILSLLMETGIYEYITMILSPIVVMLLGLPKEAASLLLLGVIRKEISLLPLLSFELTTIQIIVASIVSILYLPCISVLGIITKEYNYKYAFLIFIITFFIAILTGTIINYLYKLIMLLL